jgi:hypothetical protein
MDRGYPSLRRKPAVECASLSYELGFAMAERSESNEKQESCCFQSMVNYHLCGGLNVCDGMLEFKRRSKKSWRSSEGVKVLALKKVYLFLTKAKLLGLKIIGHTG